jgi:lysophospholipase L1-like esterase
MISIIRSELPYCDIIVMTMNPPTGEAFENRPHIADYQDGYRLVAKEQSCRLINFSPVWRDIIAHRPDLWQTYAPDGLHPNKEACSEVILPFLLGKIGYAGTSENPSPGQ